MRVFTLEEHSLYKCVGDEPSILAYNKRHNRTLDDWSAMYLQLNVAHAVETVPYRWDQGFKEAMLLEVRVRCHQCVCITDPRMADPAIKGAEKAAIVRELLQLDAGKPLMDALGDKGLTLIMLETADEWEFIIPHALLPSLIQKETVLYRFKPDACGVTSGYLKEGENPSWQSFPPSGRLPGERNEPPQWLLRMVHESK